jgi:hypothetical protein
VLGFAGHLLHLTEPAQRQHLTEAVTELPSQRQGLGAALASLAVLADEPLNPSQAP